MKMSSLVSKEAFNVLGLNVFCLFCACLLTVYLNSAQQSQLTSDLLTKLKAELSDNMLVKTEQNYVGNEIVLKKYINTLNKQLDNKQWPIRIKSIDNVTVKELPAFNNPVERRQFTKNKTNHRVEFAMGTAFSVYGMVVGASLVLLLLSLGFVFLKVKRFEIPDDTNSDEVNQTLTVKENNEPKMLSINLINRTVSYGNVDSLQFSPKEFAFYCALLEQSAKTKLVGNDLPDLFIKRCAYYYQQMVISGNKNLRHKNTVKFHDQTPATISYIRTKLQPISDEYSQFEDKFIVAVKKGPGSRTPGSTINLPRLFQDIDYQFISDED